LRLISELAATINCPHFVFFVAVKPLAAIHLASHEFRKIFTWPQTALKDQTKNTLLH